MKTRMNKMLYLKYINDIYQTILMFYLNVQEKIIRP